MKINKRKNWIWVALFSGIIFISFYLASYFGSLTTSQLKARKPVRVLSDIS